MRLQQTVCTVCFKGLYSLFIITGFRESESHWWWPKLYFNALIDSLDCCSFIWSEISSIDFSTTTVQWVKGFGRSHIFWVLDENTTSISTCKRFLVFGRMWGWGSEQDQRLFQVSLCLWSVSAERSMLLSVKPVQWCLMNEWIFWIFWSTISLPETFMLLMHSDSEARKCGRLHLLLLRNRQLHARCVQAQTLQT